jgi:hypothetical protein
VAHRQRARGRASRDRRSGWGRRAGRRLAPAAGRRAARSQSRAAGRARGSYRPWPARNRMTERSKSMSPRRSSRTLELRAAAVTRIEMMASSRRSRGPSPAHPRSSARRSSRVALLVGVSSDGSRGLSAARRRDRRNGLSASRPRGVQKPRLDRAARPWYSWTKPPSLATATVLKRPLLPSAPRLRVWRGDGLISRGRIGGARFRRFEIQLERDGRRRGGARYPDGRRESTPCRAAAVCSTPETAHPRRLGHHHNHGSCDNRRAGPPSAESALTAATRNCP